MREQHDNYLRHGSAIVPPIGMTPLDYAKVTPNRSLVRTFEMIHDTEQKDYPKSREHILAKGAACGLDDAGRCSHYQPGMKFVGFMEGQSDIRAGIRTRGSVVLRIDGATDAYRGRPVYCSGCNSFTLEKQRGAVEIGRIRYVQGGRAAVAFRRFDDDRPLNLDIRN